tara:strand:+ start:477 stop:1208 length:732 start_codon:yes stop_codon:yes gene_type:complete
MKKKNILVTGAGKGIGLATTKKLLEDGNYVFAIIRDKKDNKKFDNYDNLKIFNANVKNYKFIEKVLIYSHEIKKPITGLVNNAGIRQRKKFLKISSSDLKEIFTVNFFAAFNIMQIFTNSLIKNKLKGSIVNIASIVGQNGFSELSAYGATKGALISLTKSFATEFAKMNIRANCVSPGFTKTSFYKKFRKKKKLYNWTISRIPLSRWGNPDEIANMICFLLSDKSEYINGENINIDGGWLSG